MKKRFFTLVLFFIIASMVLGFSACGGNNKFPESVEWKRGTVSGNYTLGQLDAMTASQREELEKKYIAVEFELEYYGTLGGLFYVNVFRQRLVTAENTRPGWEDAPSYIRITCYVYEPYWKNDLKIGDIVIAEGYVEYFTFGDGSKYGYTTKEISINPCDIRKK